MRFTVEYFTDSYDEPEQYIIKDTRHSDRVVARVYVSDFRNAAQPSSDFIQTRRGLVQAELEAIEYVSHMAELLDRAVINGELR